MAKHSTRLSNTLFACIATVCAAILAAGVLLKSTSVRADSFDFINYTPPRGWRVENADEGRVKVYTRPDGTGDILLHRDSADATDEAETAFIIAWRELVEVKIPGAGQKFKPEILRQGIYTIAKGGQYVEFNGKIGFAMLTAIVGRGRKLAIVGRASGDEALREIIAFMDAVAFREPDPDPVPPASALVGRWWRSAENWGNFWYEFTGEGHYSYSTPRDAQTGTYGVQGNRITLTDSTGRATSHTFRLSCVSHEVLLELGTGRYWASPKQRCH